MSWFQRGWNLSKDTLLSQVLEANAREDTTLESSLWGEEERVWIPLFESHMCDNLVATKCWNAVTQDWARFICSCGCRCRCSCEPSVAVTSPHSTGRRRRKFVLYEFLCRNGSRVQLLAQNKQNSRHEPQKNSSSQHHTKKHNQTGINTITSYIAATPTSNKRSLCRTIRTTIHPHVPPRRSGWLQGRCNRKPPKQSL